MPEQINAVSNVLYTGVDNLYQSRLDRKQSMDFIALVADRAKATTDQLSDTLNQALVKLDQRLAVIDRKAEIFDKPETEALENAFQDFLDKAAAEGLLNNIAIELPDGKKYTIASVLDAIASADKIVSKEVLDVDANDLPSRIRYILQDGQIVTMQYNRVDDPDTGLTTITGQTADWRGLEARDVSVFQRLQFEKLVFGSPAVMVTYNHVKTTNIVFDLTSLLTAANPVAPVAPDLDGDGIIGTPAAAPDPGDTGTGDTGTGDTGTGDTGTGDTGTGDTGTGDTGTGDTGTGDTGTGDTGTGDTGTGDTGTGDTGTGDTGTGDTGTGDTGTGDIQP